jgi:hypothetical protein
MSALPNCKLDADSDTDPDTELSGKIGFIFIILL